MTRHLLTLLLFAVTAPAIRAQNQDIYLPSERDLVWKLGITQIKAWYIDHKTGKRSLYADITTDGSKKYIKETTYFDFFDKPAKRVKEEKWSDDKRLFTYFDTEQDTTGKVRLILKRYDYYTEKGFMYKRIAESMPDRYWHFTMWMDEKNPGFQNNILHKINLPADTHQIIANIRDENLHEYFVKEKQKGNWIITEQSFTRYKNGEYYGYENYRNGQLLNKYTVDTLQPSGPLDEFDREFMDEHGLPPHEHPTPSDTTWSTEYSFKTKKLISPKKTSDKQYKRIRLYMNDDKEDQIEEWIYDYRGLLIKMDILYDDKCVEYEYK